MKDHFPPVHIEIEKLFKEHYALLCLVAFSILKDKDEATDVVQEFFIYYWTKRKTLTVNVSFQAYAVRAVKNLSLLAVKKRIKEKSLLQNLGKQEYEVQKALDKPNNYERVLELLNQLPASRKEIFISSVLHGQSYAEIAETNGISINTVKTQIKRSYAFLRSKVKDKDLFYIFLISSSLI